MKSMNSEIKKVILKVKEAQSQFQTLMKSQDWVDEARKYAERQGKEVKKLFGPDLEKVRSFLERERKELERIQKQFPSEVKKLKKFVDLQKKEFEKLLSNVRKMSKVQAGNGKKATKTKRAAPKAKKKTRAASSNAQSAGAEVASGA